MTRLRVSLSCEEIEFRYAVYDATKGHIKDISRSYRSTPKRVTWVVFASNKYTHYKG